LLKTDLFQLTCEGIVAHFKNTTMNVNNSWNTINSGLIKST